MFVFMPEHFFAVIEASRLCDTEICMNLIAFRSFAKPPKAVQTICECILVMKSYREVSWKQAKAMMSEANFLKSLMEMDVDAIGNNQVRSRFDIEYNCSPVRFRA